MSEQNGKVCCNCRHCIRKKSYVGMLNGGYMVACYCDIDSSYLGYIVVMTHWCRHWSKERDKEGAENDNL